MHNLKRKPKIFIYDNVDPVTFKNIIETVDLNRTLINVVSKSGATSETLASFLILWKLIRDRKLEVNEHFVFTTDPEKGNLRIIANEYEIPCLSIPKKMLLEDTLFFLLLVYFYSKFLGLRVKKCWKVQEISQKGL